MKRTSSRRLVRSWASRRTVAISSVLALGLLLVSFASCATNVVGSIEVDAASAVPEGSAPPERDDATASDGGPCDASDPECTAAMAACETVAWCLFDTPASGARTLTAVWGASKDDVWAVGSAGTILHYDGTSWGATPSGVPNTFFGVWGSGPKDVWVVSTQAVVLHTTGFQDGGAVWDNLAPATYGSVPLDATAIYAVWGSSVSNVRLGGRGFEVRLNDGAFRYSGKGNQVVSSRTADGGLLWRALPAREDAVRSIWGSSATDVWITVDNSWSAPHEVGLTLHGTPYRGERPNPNVVNERAHCTGCVPGCTACAVLGDQLEWTTVDGQSNVVLESLWGSGPGDVWAVGALGTIRRIKAGDERWQKVDSPTQRDLHAVWGSGPDDVWFAGDKGTILHFDGTKIEPSSVQLPLGPRPDLRGIWGSGPDDVWIVGDGVTLHYTGPKPVHRGEGE